MSVELQTLNRDEISVSRTLQYANLDLKVVCFIFLFCSYSVNFSIRIYYLLAYIIISQIVDLYPIKTNNFLELYKYKIMLKTNGMKCKTCIMNKVWAKILYGCGLMLSIL